MSFFDYMPSVVICKSTVLSKQCDFFNKSYLITILSQLYLFLFLHSTYVYSTIGVICKSGVLSRQFHV